MRFPKARTAAERLAQSLTLRGCAPDASAC